MSEAGGRRAGPGAAPCLITGASGFIGGRLAARMAGEGASVRCLARASSDTAELEALGLEVVRGELADRGSLARAAQGCATVVHCAALVSDWATVAEIRDANVAGTRNLLAAAAGAGVGRLVHISTTDVYGHPGGRSVAEDEPQRRFANWYAQSKREAEHELAAFPGASPEIVVLRPATVYGPGSVEVIGEIAEAIRAGHMLLVGGGAAVAGLCYVENLLDAVLLALERPAAAGRTFNVTDGLDLSWRRLTGDLAAGLGCRPPRLSIPYPAAAAIAVTLESAYRLARRLTGLRTRPLLSRQAVQVLGRDQDFSNAALRRELGWEPRVGYEDGLAATVAWLRERDSGAAAGAGPAARAAAG